MSIRDRVFILISSLLLGAVAGALVSSVLPSPALPPAVTVITQREEVEKKSEFQEAKKSFVNIFKETAPRELLDDFLIKNEAIAAGVILTSDGWILTTSSIFEEKATFLVIIDGKPYHFSEKDSVIDKATGLAFVRIKGDGLPSQKLGDDKRVQVTEKVISFISDSDPIELQTIALRGSSFQKKEDILRSSEILSRRMEFVSSVPILIGSPIINKAGELIGIADLYKDGFVFAVPISFWLSSFRDVLRLEKISRPSLGVHYVPLSEVVLAKVAQRPERGALLLGTKNIRAVEKNSAAFEANLKEGDVILAVEGDIINNVKDLAELISEYAVETELTLSVLRAGQEISVKVKLKPSSYN